MNRLIPFVQGMQRYGIESIQSQSLEHGICRRVALVFQVLADLFRREAVGGLVADDSFNAGTSIIGEP